MATSIDDNAADGNSEKSFVEMRTCQYTRTLFSSNAVALAGNLGQYILYQTGKLFFKNNDQTD